MPTLVPNDELFKRCGRSSKPIESENAGFLLSPIPREAIDVIGTTLNGRFILEMELGRGGMGAVYRATDQILGRSVAIKVLKQLRGEEVGRRIRLEAQILARLLHENIVRLYDFGADHEAFYFIMEEVDGPSFARRLRKIVLAERLRILSQVADALDYAHHQGVIHSDVKPANVLLTSTDQAKLSDFGLSVLASESTESRVARGTPSYMSPENAQGKRLDHRSDLYALGVMIYESLTGTTPFQGPHAAVMAHHVHDQPEPPRARNPEISPELERLTLALLAKSPWERPGSGKEVAEQLRDLIHRGLLETGGRSGTAANVTLAAGSRSPEFASRPNGVRGAGTMTTSPTTTVGIDRSGPRPSGGNPLVHRLVEAVSAEPIALSADERYLCGHYLAYLLGGSRRRGFLLRRPLDPLNADRARLLLAMAALAQPEGSGVTIGQAAALLDERPDCRPSLTPVVVAKYLAARDTPKKRKHFRKLRQQLQQTSEYAARHLTDAQGVLNPGLMPQTLDDLRRIAPKRTEIDEWLVQRWNQISEVWRENAEFRNAVLRYATRSAWRDPSSVHLWPEVVYPLIERARRQRQLRSGTEAIWDALCGRLLHVGDAGVRMDRVIERDVPRLVVQKLDVDLQALEDEPELDPQAEAGPSTIGGEIHPASFEDLGAEEMDRGFVRLASPEPVRQTLGELRAYWKEAMNALRSGGGPSAGGSGYIPIGPYRITVVATIRARSAGQVAIQGMTNKQVELLVPSFTGGVTSALPVLAAWLFRNQSLAVTYLDHLKVQRFILWDAETSRQTNFADGAELNHTLAQLGLEAIEGLDVVLTKHYHPRNPV